MNPMTKEAATKERILGAAERLFAERGYEGTSLRAITAEAGANLASVNYHFRSKEGLIRAVLARHLDPLNARRIARLDAAEKAAGKGAIPVEELIRTLVEPVLRLQSDPAGGASSLKMLLGRMYAEPSPSIQRIFVGELEVLVRRFGPALRRALPALPVKDLYWRIFFMIGAMVQTMMAAPMLQMLSGGLCDPSDVQGASERLIQFVLAGMKAPASSGHKKKGRISDV